MKNLKIYTIFCLSGYRDSNAGPPAPKAGALTGLRYTPKSLSGTKVRIISQSAIPSPQEKSLGEGVARGRSDPGGIQTHDLQNRNLTLYSAKLPSLIASLCPAKVHFSSQPLDIPPSKEGVALTTGKYTSSFLVLHCFDGYSLSSKIISKGNIAISSKEMVWSRSLSVIFSYI